MTAIIRYEPKARNPAFSYPVIRCSCGCAVHCEDGWANPCDRCGTEFNGSGQRLAPRAFWGEETGESFA